MSRLFLSGSCVVLTVVSAVLSGCDGQGALPDSKPFELVGETAKATVVLAANPEESSKLAATELTNYVAKITGVTLKVKGQGQRWNERNSIVIGTLDTLKDVPAEARAALEKTENLEASWTGVKDGNLWIVGKTEVADLYATYHFLEKKLDVRWFQAPVPEDPGDYYPTAKTITLAPFAEFREPKFRIRRLDKCGAVCSHLASKAKMTAVRNGYQIFPSCACDYTDPKDKYYAFFAPRLPRRSISFGGGHGTFAYPLPAKDYFKDHPEYFALVDGKRVSEGWQYCFSNPEVLDKTADSVIAKLDKHNGDGQFLFGMVDTTLGWCECDRCRALDPKPTDGQSTPNVSTRFNIAVKRMSERIWAKWPKADLSLWAYHTYRELPEGVTQDPRLKIQFCDHMRCYGHHFDDPNCKRNADMLSLMKKWLKVSPQLYTYEYYTCSHETYDCHELDEAHDLRFYASLGVMGWKNEAAFSDSYFWPEKKNKKEYDERKDHFPSQWQWLYTTGHLLWDPYQDEQAIIDDAEAKYYGPAYPAMKKYHALRRKLWANSNLCMGYPLGDPRKPTLLNVPGAKEELLGYLDEADRLVGEVEKAGGGGQRNSATCAAAPLGAEGRAAEAAALRESQPGRPHSPYCGRLDRSAGQLERNGDHHCSPSPLTFTSVLKFRLSRDRNWLTRYWIKPNEKLREKAGKAYKAVRATTPVVIDGKGDEGAWAGAYYVTDFAGANGTKGAMPAALATTVGIVYDDEALYFLVKAKDPDMTKFRKSSTGKAWDGCDGAELFLFPPAIDNKNYHIAVTPDGLVSAMTHPGNAVADAFGVTAKGTKGPDGWTIEVRVPAAKIHPLKNGETWRVNFGLNRGGVNYSSDGDYFDEPNYRAMEIGKPYLRNGSFADLDKNGNLVEWCLDGKNSRIVPSGAGHAVVLKGRVYQLMAGGALGQKPVPRKLKFSFAAKGPGKVSVLFYRYVDTVDHKAKHGYTRRIQPQHGQGGTFALTDKMAIYNGEYTVEAGEWAAIALHSDDGVTVSSVTVDPLVK